MNKIINGKRYDTETAKLLAEWDSGHQVSDFEWYSEKLYRTKSGNYFLYGEGGGNSRYGEWHGNSGGPSERIIPMSEDAARAWAEGHTDADKYEKIFGRIEEGLVTFSMQVPPSLRDQFNHAKEKKGVTAAKLLEELLTKPQSSI